QLQKTVEELRAIQEVLRENNRELSRARTELEKRVQERTADLSAANTELRQQMSERKRLENELLEIAENERRRIGFDLHDDRAQKLTGVGMMIKGLEQQLLAQKHPSAADAVRIRTLIEDLTQHAHNLAHQYIPLDAQDRKR